MSAALTVGAAPPPTTAARRPRRLTAKTLLGVPAVVGGFLALYALWLGQRDLDPIEARALTSGAILKAAGQHTLLVGLSTAVVVALAVPLGIVLTRSWAKPARVLVQAIAVVGQVTPTFGMVILFAIMFGIGMRYAVIALIISAFLPVLTNTIAGLQAVDSSITEAARGVGMRRAQVLFTIELPLAVPVILAGLRTSIVWNAGTATIAAYAGAGGLGSIIVIGLTQNRDLVTITGAVLTTVLAILLDHAARVADHLLRPRGLES